MLIPVAFLMITVMALTGLLLGSALGQEKNQPQVQEKSNKGAEINALLKERQTLLEQRLSILTEWWKNGGMGLYGPVGYEKVLEAQMDVVQASIDAADTAHRRTAALQKCLETAEAMVKLAEDRFSVGTVTQIDVLEAKAKLAKVRIELLREEEREKLGK
jgi:hypothetical protein